LSFGAEGPESCDYPDIAKEVIQALRNKEADIAVLCCGAGIGMSIAANRFEGIRAALCCTPEMALLARTHNSANVLCLGERTIDMQTNKAIFNTFIDTNPSNEERHIRRIMKIDSNSR
jgi:ribose 5-phosphate isomerase B